MRLIYFGANSWLIELGQQRILIDPWLVGSLMFGNLTWLFKGQVATITPGQTFSLANQIEIRALPGAPIGLQASVIG
jgi:L-ascorbate metabolism protein UlaG (beta-lactamase superfamily)